MPLDPTDERSEKHRDVDYAEAHAEVMEEWLGDQFAEDPGGIIWLGLNAIDKEKHPAVIAEIRDHLLAYEPNPVVLPRRCQDILQCLATAHKPLLQEEIAVAIHSTRKTIGLRLSYMEDCNMVHHQAGERGGVSITSKGREYLATARRSQEQPSKQPPIAP